MSQAFQISEDDARVVLERMNLPAGEQNAQDAMSLLEPHDARITQAALHGLDLDEQTRFAQEEIEAVLREQWGLSA